MNFNPGKQYPVASSASILFSAHQSKRSVKVNEVRPGIVISPVKTSLNKKAIN